MSARNPTTTPTAQTSTLHEHGTTSIDLEPARKVVGDSFERRAWLAEMQTPGGMSPGSSARAHARAFRFAEALAKKGYRVLEGAYGPRGGRRFILASYDGPRAAAIHRLKANRGCIFEHPGDDCACFDDLTDDQLAATARLTRLANRPPWGQRYNSDRIAVLVRTQPAAHLTAVTALYAANGGTHLGAPTLEELLDLVQRHGETATATALGVFLQCRTTHEESQPVSELAAALAAALSLGTEGT